MQAADPPTDTVEASDWGDEEVDSDDPEILRRELRRRERERRKLVARYERLLDERNERIDELRESESERTLRRRLSGLFDVGF